MKEGREKWGPKEKGGGVGDFTSERKKLNNLAIKSIKISVNNRVLD